MSADSDRPLWFTWGRQRRSFELARVLGCRLYYLESKQPYGIKVILLSLRTLLLVLRHRPKLVFVQNPSIVLASLACFLAPVFRFKLVVDRHTNFYFRKMNSRAPKWRIYHSLSRWSVKRADLTIVTNDPLRKVVEDWGGRGFVLPDPLPELNQAGEMPLSHPAVACVCSFDGDEPITEIVAAAAACPPEINFYITGNPARAPQGLVENAPPNVTFTGFLPESDYQSLLASVDVVMVLTTRPHTLVCGAYEAVTLGKPFVTSNFDDLRAYFRQGAVYTDANPEAIASAVQEALDRRSELAAEVEELGRGLEADWSERGRRLRNQLGLADPTDSSFR